MNKQAEKTARDALSAINERILSIAHGRRKGHFAPAQAPSAALARKSRTSNSSVFCDR
jgi:hypothetical protein